jgi:acetylornithine deacetylase/succinyl-diaminopimelate desuccinylase-like protein
LRHHDVILTRVRAQASRGHTPALDPELRVFARAASDDKALITMFLAAFDGLKALGADPTNHVKVLLDSEEEKGSPAMRAVAGANKDLLACDVLVIQDGPHHPSERPTIAFGNRGAAHVTLPAVGTPTSSAPGSVGQTRSLDDMPPTW